MLRIVLTLMLGAASYAVSAALTPQATLLVGSAAGRQFENSDVAFLTTSYLFNAVTMSHWILGSVAFLLLIGIWWTPIRNLFRNIVAEAKKQSAPAIMLLVGAGMFAAALLSATDARAFFEKTDRTEIVPILPNESAFWIPNVGNVRDNQVQMDSEEFLNKNKIAARNFQVPHVKLTGSAGTSVFSGWDYFVPAGRLIKVDRTPFSREWVDASDRGTSSRKEGFPCQTNEGLNVTAGVAIGTSVTEADAAKFLYRFGVHPPAGKLSADGRAIDADGQIIFASVYHGRSLKEVMDDVGRKYMLSTVCAEIGARSLNEANAQMTVMMQSIEKKARAYLSSVGITLDFLGWGDTLEFDKEIQSALNRRYAAQIDEQIAKALGPHSQTIQALAAAEAIRSFGVKSDGKLPTTIVGLPTGLGSLLESLLKSTTEAPAR